MDANKARGFCLNEDSISLLEGLVVHNLIQPLLTSNVSLEFDKRQANSLIVYLYCSDCKWSNSPPRSGRKVYCRQSCEMEHEFRPDFQTWTSEGVKVTGSYVGH